MNPKIVNQKPSGIRMKRDLYEILGVSKNATNEEIKKAYKSKVKEFHPDNQNGISEDEKNKMIREVNRAKILIDPEKRSQYDSGEHEEATVDPVKQWITIQVSQCFNEEVFEHRQIWRKIVKENKSERKKLRKTFKKISKFKRNIKTLIDKNDLVGTVAKKNYEELKPAMIQVRELLRNNRKVSKLIEKDCSFIDEILKGDDVVNDDLDKFFNRHMRTYP